MRRALPIRVVAPSVASTEHRCASRSSERRATYERGGGASGSGEFEAGRFRPAQAQGHDARDLMIFETGGRECWTRCAGERHRAVLHARWERIGPGMMPSAAHVSGRNGVGRARDDGRTSPWDPPPRTRTHRLGGPAEAARRRRAGAKEAGECESWSMCPPVSEYRRQGYPRDEAGLKDSSGCIGGLTPGFGPICSAPSVAQRRPVQLPGRRVTLDSADLPVSSVASSPETPPPQPIA